MIARQTTGHERDRENRYNLLTTEFDEPTSARMRICDCFEVTLRRLVSAHDDNVLLSTHDKLFFGHFSARKMNSLLPQHRTQAQIGYTFHRHSDKVHVNAREWNSRKQTKIHVKILNENNRSTLGGYVACIFIRSLTDQCLIRFALLFCICRCSCCYYSAV